MSRVASRSITKISAPWQGCANLLILMMICVVSAPLKASAKDSSPTELNNSETLGYNGFAVCDYTNLFFSNSKMFLTKQEFEAIKSGKSNKRKMIIGGFESVYPLLVYSHNGIEVGYNYEKSPKIWAMHLEGTRLPAEMRTKNYFISHFDLSSTYQSYDILQMSCDYSNLTVYFNGDDVAKIIVDLSPSVN